MTDPSDELLSLIHKDFGLTIPEKREDTIEKIIQWLTIEIGYMIDRDFNSFLNMLYRIDVNEQKVKEAFTKPEPTNEIARLIVERELQKVETRAKYKE